MHNDFNYDNINRKTKRKMFFLVTLSDTTYWTKRRPVLYLPVGSVPVTKFKRLDIRHCDDQTIFSTTLFICGVNFKKGGGTHNKLRAIFGGRGLEYG